MKKLISFALTLVLLLLSAVSLAQGDPSAPALFLFWGASPASPPEEFLRLARENGGFTFQRKEGQQLADGGVTYIPYTASMEPEPPTLFGSDLTQAIATFQAGADGVERFSSLELYFSFASPLTQFISRAGDVFLGVTAQFGPITGGYCLVGPTARYNAPLQGNALDSALLQRLLSDNREYTTVVFVWQNIQYSLTCIQGTYQDQLLVLDQAIPPLQSPPSLGSYAGAP